MERLTLMVATRDRHSELALLLQSLRTQSYKYWDLVILDENQTPIEHNYFLSCLLTQIKIEGHHIQIHQNPESFGVCHARNKCIEIDYFNNPIVGRIDDDVILQPDYLEKLMEVIDEGYDIASGITPLIGRPKLERQINRVKPIINVKKFDKKGNITKYEDNCGCYYNKEEILPTHEFRSCAIMKKKVAEKVKYEDNLSPVGFREEAFYSFRAQMEHGFKIGVHTGALALHFATPSGGCRYPDYREKVASDDKYFKKWAKKMWSKHGPL